MKRFENVQEALDAWDNGDEIFSVSMGGLGVAYEQAIQTAGFEMLRILLEIDCDMEKVSVDEKYRDIINKYLEKDFFKKAKKYDSLYGLSGAQFSAGKNLAFVFYKNGHSKGLDMADKDRIILVKKRC